MAMEPRSQGAWLGTLERRGFRALNAVSGPLVRRGFGSPCLTPWGLVVLEHTGARSGRRYASPLWAIRVGRRVVVTTYRTTRSHWLRNLERRPETFLWIHGERRPVRAQVLDPSRRDGADRRVERVARPLRPAVRVLLAAGFAVSVLEPA